MKITRDKMFFFQKILFIHWHMSEIIANPIIIPATIHANIAATQIPDLHAPTDIIAATNIPTIKRQNF